jgi:hypothetical protein
MRWPPLLKCGEALGMVVGPDRGLHEFRLQELIDPRVAASSNGRLAIPKASAGLWIKPAAMAWTRSINAAGKVFCKINP